MESSSLSLKPLLSLVRKITYNLGLRLISQLKVAASADDYASLNGFLGTANSIFRHTDDQLLELKYCHDTFMEPLIDCFLFTDALLETTGNTVVKFRSLLESQTMCCCIWLSLSFQVLPERFKNRMESLMLQLSKYLLTFPIPELVQVADDLRCAVITFINHCTDKHVKDFEHYVAGFLTTMLPLVEELSTSGSRHELATTAIKYFTTVSTSPRHHYLFGDENAVKIICLNIVIPNVLMRVEEEEELFELNYMEFIRRDMEPSGVENRRRMACELLKGLVTNYANDVICVLLPELQNLHSSFSEDRTAMWRREVCVIDLVISVGDIIGTAFQKIILAELRRFYDGSYPMLKARCLKFLAKFCANIRKSVGIELFVDLARLLQAESNVVHSYAASCIEKLLLVKEEGGERRYAARDIGEVLILRNLFDALKLVQSEENPYVMKCIMRVLGVAEMNGNEAARSYIVRLTAVLTEVCKLPKTSVFNHYLFESIALLLRRAYEGNLPPTSAFQMILFPRVQMILERKIAEFMPYALQLMAQFVELNHTASDHITNMCLLHDLDFQNLAGLVRLLQTVLPISRDSFHPLLANALTIAEKHVSSPESQNQGFDLLCLIFKELRPTRTDMEHVLTVLFQLYQTKSTLNFQKSLVLFCSLVVVAKGQRYLKDSINALQDNLFFHFLDAIWIPCLKLMKDWEKHEIRLATVAATKVLGDLEYYQNLQAGARWGTMLDSIITLVLCPEKPDYEMPQVLEDIGDSENFLIIQNAIKKEDHTEEIPKELLVRTVSDLSRLAPGALEKIIADNLDESNKVAWVQLCNEASRGF